MQIITSTSALEAACSHLASGEFVTVDTEFIRETTFWPELCLIQCATPLKGGEYEVYIIDPMAKGMNLAPFFRLMADERVMKVFHAARQDIEIIHKLAGIIPHPIFDTQVAAMVCGFGDSISYDQLVYKITGEGIDKSSRFTDWKRRPLSDKQLDYAAADVTHLRTVYEAIRASLTEQGRAHWVAEEMEILTSPSTYEQLPENAWQRLKLRVRKPRELLILKKVAEWRERQAQALNVPRGRILKDEAIYEIAGHPPQTMDDIEKMRGLSRGFDKARFGAQLIAVTGEALATPKANLPVLPKQKQQPEGCSAAAEMLKLLLKLVAEQNGVAAKIIATSDDIERIAADDGADVEALKGWRMELFGRQALRLKHGEIAIGYRNRKISLVEIGGGKTIATAAE